MGAASTGWIPLRSSWCHVGCPERLGPTTLFGIAQAVALGRVLHRYPYTWIGTSRPWRSVVSRASHYNTCSAPFDTWGFRTAAYLISTRWLAIPGQGHSSRKFPLCSLLHRRS